MHDLPALVSKRSRTLRAKGRGAAAVEADGKIKRLELLPWKRPPLVPRYNHYINRTPNCSLTPPERADSTPDSM